MSLLVQFLIILRFFGYPQNNLSLVAIGETNVITETFVDKINVDYLIKRAREYNESKFKICR